MNRCLSLSVETPLVRYLELVDEPPVVTPQLRATLEAVIRRGDEIAIQAFSTLNAQLMALVYTGRALQLQLDNLKALVATGAFMVARTTSSSNRSR
jgi:hypothetical protein